MSASTNNISPKQPKFDFAIGGQAVIEGVMMRSKNFIAIAVRKKDDSIKIKDFPFQSLLQKYKWLNIPIVRGVIGMIEMMIVGFKALDFSSNEFELEEEPENNVSKKNQSKKEPSAIWGVLFMIANLVLSLIIALSLFKFVPLYVTDFITEKITIDNYVIYNVIDGVIKLLLFMLYVYLISLTKTIKRVFEYHGAEHKAVFNYEKNIPLTVKNSQIQTRFHPRCGTSFVVFIFLISIILYTFLPKDPNFILQFSKRILFLPIVVGISYEVLKLSARYSDSKLVKLLILPGLAFQGLTTKEPDDSQVEVALAALQRTLDLEETL